MPEEVVVEQPVTETAPVVEQPVVEAKAEPTGDAAPAQEATPDDTQPRDEKGKFKSPVQSRIDELTRARHEAEREAAYWRQRATPAEAAPTPPAKPTVDQFQDYGEFLAAQTNWQIAEAIKADRAAAAEEAAKSAEQRAAETKAKTFFERAATFRANAPDYDAVMDAASTPISKEMYECLQDSEQGPALAYHFAKNPAEADRISALPPLAAAREIGRIEATLGKPEAVQKPVSKAPAPMKPQSGVSSTVTNDPAKMSHEEYRAYRAKQGARWA